MALLVTGGVFPAVSTAQEENTPIPDSVPQLDIKGFGNMGFISEKTVGAEKKEPNTFSLGTVDLFITSELTDRTRFLAEIVYERHEQNHSMNHLARLVLQYSLNNQFKIKIGRLHTDFGYWNGEFHHGTWFQTTALRPKFFEFEHDGGLLPIHTVGMYVHGIKEFSSLEIKYGIGVSNGRGKTSGEVQDFQDSNDYKAINTRISISSSKLPGLSGGFSTYFDRIPRVESDPFRQGEIKESIWGGHVVYKRKELELINEFAWIIHDDLGLGEKFESLGYYLQISKSWRMIRPYYRLEYSDVDELDPYWGDISPIQDDYTTNLFGIKWNINIWSSLKIEYALINYRGIENGNKFVVQSGFTF